jgi:hypothetical protein
MVSGGDGDFELRADAIGRGDEDRVPVPRGLEIEEGAEPAQARIAAGPRRRFGERLDRLDQSVAGIDVDAGIAVILPLYGALARYAL